MVPSFIDYLKEKKQVPGKQAMYLYLVLLLASAKFIVQPLFEWRAELAQQVDSQSMQLRELNSVSQAQKDYQQASEQLKSTIEVVDKHVFKTTSIQSLQLQLQRKIEPILNELELEQKRANWQPIELKGDIKAVKLSLSVDGRSKGFMQFVERLESNTPRLLVSDFFVRSVGRNDKLSINIGIIAYYREQS
ncbi:hypothetical protein CWC31_06660 [Pseudoalteromonas ruthenica]|uniref:GspMb/PilO family protein n=1 Tax=Pseudoalteromonas ruthenica TaxID=151081 RepID=UPI001108CD6C|nr:GspMb/PilO family protein [Pseudoalteromonas ruthenica]TLX51292.1 hypothetical protein CWC31_06660 [Pseudoalteromonas ruthenica]|tara:strand:- start:11189 stop:11761 length:573 start_codon:yes stop_codon:yes gene_type:complete